jgi:hypothetical protein
MSRVIHFEVMAGEPQRATKFYANVFGWQIHKWDGPADYWLVTTGAEGTPGINGGIGQSQGEPLTVNTIEVDSLEAMVEKVMANGGQVVVPKMTIPGVGYQVYCKDTEGIVFGLHQADPEAQ